MAAPDIPPHTSPIRTPKQLVIVVLLAFIVPITIILALAYLVTSGPRPDPDSAALSPEKVAERIRPVAEVTIGGAGGGGAQGAKTGEEVFKSVCMACHATGVAGAPKFGDKAQWGPRIKTGEKALLQSALKGKGGMPPKGGASNLSDAEVERAVVYMANAGGAKFKEPAAPQNTAPAQQNAQAQPAPAADPSHDHDHGAPAAQPAAAPAANATKASSKADGKKVFEGTCVVCHGTGVAGAPKFGDKAAWAPHLMHGKDELYHSALTGKNAMPPKGGNMTLSDDEVKAAVDYMVGAVK